MRRHLPAFYKVAKKRNNAPLTSLFSSPQTDSLPDIENILRISLECKALLNALHVDSSPRQIQRDSEDASGEVGMLANKVFESLCKLALVFVTKTQLTCFNQSQ